MAGSTPASPTIDAAPGGALSPALAGGGRARRISPARDAWRRFRRHRLALLSAVVLTLLVLTILIGPLLWTVPIDDIDFSARLASPSFTHPLGTDDLGQDLLARLIYGGKVSLSVGLCAMAVAVTVGVLVGAVAGMSSGRIDAALMWLADLFLALPQLPLLLLLIYLFRDKLTAILGTQGGVFVLVVPAIGCLRWMPVSRLVRAQFFSLREKEFVEAARALGASRMRMVMRHLLPNAMGPIIVTATIEIRQRHHRRIDAFVSGPWFSTRCAHLGTRAVRREGLSRRRAALGAVPGIRDFPHCAFDQLHR